MGNSFIRRPVLSIVISTFITLLGLLAMVRMPMSLFPNIAPPEVNVTVEYTGANAETVTKAAIVPLERAINGVPGMKYMSSDAGNDGVGVVQILFETGTDPDIAAVNVQNRVSAVMGELPSEVIRNGVKIGKEENAMLMYVSIHSSNDDHDEKFLYNFADINVLAEIKRIDGVGYADILGAKEYAMRIWLKPDRMATYGIATDDVLDAIDAFNLEAAPGKIGDNSGTGNAPLQYTISYTGKYQTEEQYERIPLRSDEQHGVLVLGDVAEIEFGTTYFDVESRFDGRPAASILLKQLPGSNARDVIAKVKKLLVELEEQTFLPGMRYDLSFDVSRFLDASLREVVWTFLEAFLLVGLVVFVFLQNFRSTLIPIVAVPVSLVGTFFFIQFLGFSLNLVTMFALVLAIGIVVDNAIVVVEAVHQKLERGATDLREATAQALSEIESAIIAITLVMAAVFVPMGFIDGPAGQFYRQFALTMAIAIVLSGIVALTLTPALCAMWLAAESSSSGHRGPWIERFDRVYSRVESLYRSALEGTIGRTGLVAGLVVAFGILALVVAARVPSGFIPEEDQGIIYASVNSPAGATLERTKEVVAAIQREAEMLDEVESVATLAGTNVLSDGTGATYGTCLINLKPWDERKASVDSIMEDLEERLAGIHGAEIDLFPPPSIPGYGNASGFELRLLDKTGRGDLGETERVLGEFLDALEDRPEIASAFSIFNASFPQYTVTIDVDRAAQKGVTAESALATLQTMVGSEYASNFIRFGQMYKVMVQASPEYRVEPEQLLELRTRGDSGELVPLSTFMLIEKTSGVDQLTRYNMYPSAEINGDGRPGISSGEVLAAVAETASDELPPGFAIDWAGISRDEVNAGNQGALVALMCLVFVYLVLSAQYESFVLPMAVILSLTPGIFGAFAFLLGFGLENNIFSHIALIVIMGLLGKNAILIVEFAEQEFAAGHPASTAVLRAALLRLRPILMTSLAFIAGLLPLMFASGAAAMGNRTIGTATVGGMLIGTFFGLLLTPGLYVICKSWTTRTIAESSRPAARDVAAADRGEVPVGTRAAAEA